MALPKTSLTHAPAANSNLQQFVAQPFIAIPDNGTTSSTLTVNGMSGTLIDLNVSVNIDHAWDTDLDVYLITPTGQAIELFTDVGGRGHHFTNTVLDNEASTPIGQGNAPFTGSYRPEGDLASTDGLSPNGVWTLKVTDDEAEVVGTLNAWSLDVSTFEANHAPTGTASFTLAKATQDTAYPISANNLLQGFSDVDGDTLSVANLSASNGTLTALNGGWTFMPTASYNGAVALNYTVTDGKGGNVAATQSFSVGPLVTPVTPAFIITKNDLFTGEDGDTAIISVQLATAPMRDVAVTFTGSDLTEGTINNPTLTFTSSNWSIAQACTVVGQNDYLNDGNQPNIITAVINSDDVNYRQIPIDFIVITNIEDVTTVADARIPSGKPRDAPIKLIGDIQVDTAVIVDGFFKPVTTFPANDTFQGLDGNDTLYGGNLQDDLSGGIGNDTLYGENDQDFLYGQDGDDVLNGGNDADKLNGGAGNDSLDGGSGLDTLIGGAGNDTYYLGYDAVDIIDDQGLVNDIDTVIMPYQLTRYTLPAGIEIGTITPGTVASDLTGNEGNNTLTGNDGKNMLIGAVGRDSLFGGVGNDVLVGGTGNDTLSGGAGSDVFKFDAALTANTDKITDFSVVNDTIQLENAVFSKLATTGVLDASLFAKTAAHDANDYIIYNSTTGAVSYDADGNGAGSAVQIAVLGTNLALSYADFVVI